MNAQKVGLYESIGEIKMVETGWLLEHPDTSRGVNYMTLRPDIAGFWTADANLALRFARKCDAEDFESYFGPVEGEGSKAVEHRWE
jgi:hypothetical protein